MVDLVHPYLHAFDFPYHDELLEKAESLKKDWDERIDNTPTEGYNLSIMDEEFRQYLEGKIVPIVALEYGLRVPDSPQAPCWMYIQDDKDFASVWHRHCYTQMMCGLVCSTYLNPPSEGGKFEFIGDDPNNSIRLTPEKDKLYVFPNWLLHRPLPQKDSTTRFCLTYQYVYDRRISHPKTDILW